MKKTKKIGAFLCVVCLIVFIRICTIPRYPEYTAATCIESKPIATKFFSKPLAVNDNYLAVGDPDANRVRVYQRQSDDNWLQVREILPPTNSNADRIGVGFGADLALNNGILAIHSANLNWKKSPVDNRDNTEELFTTSIYSSDAVQNIDYPSVNSVPISSFSIFGDKIAIGTRTEVAPERWSNRVYIADTKNGKTIDVIESSEFQDEVDYPYANFNVHLDSFRDLLVIMNLNQDWNNFAYLLSSDNKLQKIPFDLEEINNLNQKTFYCAGEFIDLSKELLVTGCPGGEFDNFGTFIFEDFPTPTLTEHYLGSGTINAEQPHVLLTWRSVSYGNGAHHTLLKIQDDKTIDKSLIWWSYNVDTYRSISRSKGVIGEQDLFLSAEDGRVVRLPIEGLPPIYKMEQNICGE